MNTYEISRRRFLQVVAFPIALVFNLFLDRFIAGFTMGAVKG